MNNFEKLKSVSVIYIEDDMEMAKLFADHLAKYLKNHKMEWLVAK